MAKKNKSATLTTYKQPTRKPHNDQRSGRKKTLCREICDLCDPFCASACTKLPDGNTKRSLPFSVRGFATVPTHPDGDRAFWFRPSLASLYEESQTITGGNVTVWTASRAVPDFSSLDTNFYEYRIVSFGVRVFGSANFDASKGAVTIATHSGDFAITGLDVENSNYLDIQRYPINNCDVTWVSKPQGAESYEFVPLGDPCQRTGVAVIVTGAAASTTVAQIEYIVNIELVPKVELFVSRLATPPRQISPGILKASEMALSEKSAITEGGVEKTGAGFWDTAGKVVDTLERVAPMLLPLFV